jgi:ATP-binding cassette subfamily F protein 3
MAGARSGDLAREKGIKGKELRQSGAEQRVRLKPLRQALQKTEKQLERLQTELAKLQSALADPTLYDADQRDRLATIVKDEGALKAEVEGLEERWMEQQQALEDASE